MFNFIEGGGNFLAFGGASDIEYKWFWYKTVLFSDT
jgi:hypothetical protein